MKIKLRIFKLMRTEVGSLRRVAKEREKGLVHPVLIDRELLKKTMPLEKKIII